MKRPAFNRKGVFETTFHISLTSYPHFLPNKGAPINAIKLL